MTTTFRRQMTLTICLMLAAVTLIGAVFWAAINHYVTRQREQSLTQAADSLATLAGVYSSVPALYLDWDFRMNLSLASNVADNEMLVCAPDGTVLLCAQAVQGCAHVGQSIGQDLAKGVFAAPEGVRIDRGASSLYQEDRIAVAVGAKTADGTPLCIVIASIRTEERSALTAAILRILIMTALVVFLVMLLALPYLTRRETRPIKDMAAAARQLARGNLQVRVATGHHNEEIEELAIAFNNMAAEMQNAETVRQEFVANVSHELKTPMTTIAGYLDGMLDGTIPPERQRTYMELVSTEVRRLSRLVRNMLEISRLQEAGIAPEAMTTFDICEAMGEALLSFEQRINGKSLDVEVDLPEFPVPVRALRDAVTQVLYNLLDNGVKFADEGGRLALRVTQQGDKVLVSVSNTGPTIPPEELPMLFDRFHKTDKSRSTDRDGVGLGLYIVKTIVLAHGENVFVTSRDGVTQFSFTLPAEK